MKISIFSIPSIPLGKHNIKDNRLDQIDSVVKAPKKTYVQVELVGGEAALEADAILAPKDSRTDLVLRDLEFIEKRLANSEEQLEKNLLHKLKGILEKEEFIFQAGLSEEEKRSISVYGLITAKPVVLAEEKELDDLDVLLLRCFQGAGFINFFTATGGREIRAWLLKKGSSAWEAAGSVHSDIQQGFIRAEIISFTDFIQTGGETAAKQAGLMRLEQKEYVIQDADIVNFRFNK